MTDTDTDTAVAELAAQISSLILQEATKTSMTHRCARCSIGSPSRSASAMDGN